MAREEKPGLPLTMRKAKVWLTYGLLRHYGACLSARKLFSKRFPTRRVEVTEQNAIRYARSFNTDWLCQALPEASRPQFFNIRNAMLAAGVHQHGPGMRIALAVAFASLVRRDGFNTQ